MHSCLAGVIGDCFCQSNLVVQELVKGTLQITHNSIGLVSFFLVCVKIPGEQLSIICEVKINVNLMCSKLLFCVGFLFRKYKWLFLIHHHFYMLLSYCFQSHFLFDKINLLFVLIISQVAIKVSSICIITLQYLKFRIST